jgi:hypothetical protein
VVDCSYFLPILAQGLSAVIVVDLSVSSLAGLPASNMAGQTALLQSKRNVVSKRH